MIPGWFKRRSWPSLPILLLCAYTCCLPLRRLLHLPVVKAKLQLTELIFIPLVLVAAASIWQQLQREGRRFVLLLVPYLLTLSGAALFSGALDSILEVVGRYYLVGLLLTVSALVAAAPETTSRYVFLAYRGALGIIVATALAGYGSLWFGYASPWVLEFKGFPYLGTVYRAASAAGSPTDTVLLATLPILLEWRRWRKGEVRPWLLLLAWLVLVLTLSKDIAIPLLGCWLVDPALQAPRNHWVIKWGCPVALGVLYLAWAHYLPEKHKVYTPENLAGVHWTGGVVAWQNDYFQLTETTYVATKRGALALLADEPWLGVGPDRMEKLIGAKVASGAYPANLPHFRPHSTWFGALAETGWLGFSALLWLTVGLLHRGRKQWHQIVRQEDWYTLSVFLLLLLAASLIVDTLHLRYVWLPLGMWLGWSLYPSHGDLGPSSPAPEKGP